MIFLKNSQINKIFPKIFRATLLQRMKNEKLFLLTDKVLNNIEYYNIENVDPSLHVIDKFQKT